MRVLLIEDDQMLGRALSAGLKREGPLDWVQTAEDAELALRSFTFDVVIADIGLPGKSGLALVKNMRQARNKTPVLFLTARDTTRDRIHGLDSGGDDYLVKPFDFGELLARIRALVRRSTGNVEPSLRACDVVVDTVGKTVMQNDKRINVSAREYDILCLLIGSKNRVVSKDVIEAKIYDMSQSPESNTVEVHISNLRRKLGKSLIRTNRGMGYSIEDGSA
jgi:DNA-binding response OmpR family regulator